MQMKGRYLPIAMNSFLDCDESIGTEGSESRAGHPEHPPTIDSSLGQEKVSKDHVEFPVITEGFELSCGLKRCTSIEDRPGIETNSKRKSNSGDAIAVRKSSGQRKYQLSSEGEAGRLQQTLDAEKMQQAILPSLNAAGAELFGGGGGGGGGDLGASMSSVQQAQAMATLASRGSTQNLPNPQGLQTSNLSSPFALGTAGNGSFAAAAALQREQNLRNQLLSQIGPWQNQLGLQLQLQQHQLEMNALIQQQQFPLDPLRLQQQQQQQQHLMGLESLRIQQQQQLLQLQRQQQQRQELSANAPLWMRETLLNSGGLDGLISQRNVASSVDATTTLASILAQDKNEQQVFQEKGSTQPGSAFHKVAQGKIPPGATAGNQDLKRNSPTPPSTSTLELPPSFSDRPDPWFSRSFFPLGMDEDPNWLSEFHCLVRNDFVELFRASAEDVQARNNSITFLQVGMRCRYCAHLKPSSRAGRSCAYPSSLRQIYQSFTMMLRDHFAQCDAIPNHLLQRFVTLKEKPAQGATDSKRYWIYSAMKVGLVDSATQGIRITNASVAAGNEALPFGSNPNKQWIDGTFATVQLVMPADRPLVSEFLFVIMSQVQPIRLMESECIGNRRSLPVGLPGFGCRFCCQRRRLGLCRMFPARRRTLPGKINDMYNHLRRCSFCPDQIKEQLANLHYQFNGGKDAEQGTEHEFYDRVWSRLGHDTQSA